MAGKKRPYSLSTDQVREIVKKVSERNRREIFKHTISAIRLVEAGATIDEAVDGAFGESVPLASPVEIRGAVRRAMEDSAPKIMASTIAAFRDFNDRNPRQDRI